MNDYLFYGLLIFYLIGYLVHFRLFIKDDVSLLDGWAKVFVAAYYSLMSWVAVLMYYAFTTKSNPPKWLTGK